jgi:amidohydrolase
LKVLSANMNNTVHLIEVKSRAIEPKLVELRRDLHQHPELSNREFRTAEKVAAFLTGLGLRVQAGVAKTGVVGILEGSQPGPTVAIRADMDALPINELNEVPYKSKNEGVKHACGHDVHTTIGLGVAEVLSGLREQINGRIKFIFQPAEEGAPPGEEGGASLMIEEGVLESPSVEAIFGLHVMPTIEVGNIGYSAGPVWASNDTLEMIISGRKTHGAYPHTGVDAITVASHALVALQTMISRSVDTREPLIISIGIIEGGNQYNVLADRVRLVGIIRSLSPEIRASAPDRIEAVLRGITQTFGASYTMNITPGAPVTINDPKLVQKVVPVLEQLLGKDHVLLQKPQMGAEDFACFAEKIPGFYFLLGVRNEGRGITEMLHTPRFDVDEACLALGVNTMSQIVAQYLAAASASF